MAGTSVHGVSRYLIVSIWKPQGISLNNLCTTSDLGCFPTACVSRDHNAVVHSQSFRDAFSDAPYWQCLSLVQPLLAGFRALKGFQPGLQPPRIISSVDLQRCPAVKTFRNFELSIRSLDPKIHKSQRYYTYPNGYVYSPPLKNCFKSKSIPFKACKPGL